MAWQRAALVAGLSAPASFGAAQTLHVNGDADVILDGKARRNGNEQRLRIGDVPSTEDSHRRASSPGRHAALVRFDLSPLPASYAIARATLQVWVRTLHRRGVLEVHPVLEAWEEGEISGRQLPAWGPSVASVPVGEADEARYLVVDVTPTVEDWLGGTQPAHGFALLAADELRVEIDSKESVLTSHAAELVVVPEGTGGGSGSPGPPGPPGPPGLPLPSFDALAGLPCDLSGKRGVIRIKYRHKGEVELKCVEGPGPVCTDGDDDDFFAQPDCGTPPDCNDANPAVHPGATEACSDSVDNDCDGQVDEDCVPVCADLDGDGWMSCEGDCCDTPAGCPTPALVNPGAYEFVGNGVDDDCDAATSDASPDICSVVVKFTGVTAGDLAAAIDLCRLTTTSPPLTERRWGLISAELVSPDGSALPAARLAQLQDWQTAVLQSYGTGGVLPQVGATLAGLSTGRMRDINDLGYVAPNEGTDFSATGQPPAAYLAAHGGELPASFSCYGLCPAGQGANDAVALRLAIRVPTNARSLLYRYSFFSAEYWQWSCTQYNDFHLALLQTGATGIPADRNIAYDALANPVSVNNFFVEACTPRGCQTCPAGPTPLNGTGMDDLVAGPPPYGEGRTGAGILWKDVTAPVVPGETITLDLMVFDVSDGRLDSVVLLDGFSWKP